MNREEHAETISVSDMWRIIGKHMGASNEQVENLVQSMNAITQKKEEESRENEEEEEEEEDDDDDTTEYPEEEYVKHLEDRLGELDCFGTAAPGIEGDLNTIAISVNILAQYFLEKELYQIQNRKGK
jgi:hypothetical protein